MFGILFARTFSHASKNASINPLIPCTSICKQHSSYVTWLCELENSWPDKWKHLGNGSSKIKSNTVLMTEWWPNGSWPAALMEQSTMIRVCNLLATGIQSAVQDTIRFISELLNLIFGEYSYRVYKSIVFCAAYTCRPMIFMCPQWHDRMNTAQQNTSNLLQRLW